MTSHERDIRDRSNIRRNRERHIYVIEFASGMVKVGQTIDPKSRLNAHIAGAQVHGDQVTRHWFSGVHTDFVENEQALISFCSARWPGTVGTEYFQGADFEQIVEHAHGLPFRRLTAGEVAALEEASHQRLAGLTAGFHDRQRRAELLAATELAKGQVELIVSLANDENRWAASDAIFNIVRKLYEAIPSAWAETDPTAAMRYLVSCGAPVDVAQREAAGFELGMRVLYALSHYEEAASFEDLARFCSPYMPAGGESL